MDKVIHRNSLYKVFALYSLIDITDIETVLCDNYE